MYPSPFSRTKHSTVIRLHEHSYTAEKRCICEHTYADDNTAQGRDGSLPKLAMAYHPVTWCLSEALRCVSKLLLEVKRKSISARVAYWTVTLKKRAWAVLSSSKKVVLFQCMSHLAIILYLWLSELWHWLRLQCNLLTAQRERDRERKRERWSKEKEGEKEG